MGDPTGPRSIAGNLLRDGDSARDFSGIKSILDGLQTHLESLSAPAPEFDFASDPERLLFHFRSHAADLQIGLQSLHHWVVEAVEESDSADEDALATKDLILEAIPTMCCLSISFFARCLNDSLPAHAGLLQDCRAKYRAVNLHFSQVAFVAKVHRSLSSAAPRTLGLLDAHSVGLLSSGRPYDFDLCFGPESSIDSSLSPVFPLLFHLTEGQSCSFVAYSQFPDDVLHSLLGGDGADGLLFQWLHFLLDSNPFLSLSVTMGVQYDSRILDLLESSSPSPAVPAVISAFSSSSSLRSLLTHTVETPSSLACLLARVCQSVQKLEESHNGFSSDSTLLVCISLGAATPQFHAPSFTLLSLGLTHERSLQPLPPRGMILKDVWDSCLSGHFVLYALLGESQDSKQTEFALEELFRLRSVHVSLDRRLEDLHLMVGKCHWLRQENGAMHEKCDEYSQKMASVKMSYADDIRSLREENRRLTTESDRFSREYDLLLSSLKQFQLQLPSEVAAYVEGLIDTKPEPKTSRLWGLPEDAASVPPASSGVSAQAAFASHVAEPGSAGFPVSDGAESSLLPSSGTARAVFKEPRFFGLEKVKPRFNMVTSSLNRESSRSSLIAPRKQTSSGNTRNQSRLPLPSSRTTSANSEPPPSTAAPRSPDSSSTTSSLSATPSHPSFIPRPSSRSPRLRDRAADPQRQHPPVSASLNLNPPARRSENPLPRHMFSAVPRVNTSSSHLPYAGAVTAPERPSMPSAAKSKSINATSSRAAVRSAKATQMASAVKFRSLNARDAAAATKSQVKNTSLNSQRTHLLAARNAAIPVSPGTTERLILKAERMQRRRQKLFGRAQTRLLDGL